MSCLGTIIGGTIGLFLGGPLGAIAGAAFGSFISGAGARFTEKVDGGEQDRYSAWYGNRMNRSQHNQMTFFVGAFSMLAKLAAIDGKVSEKERRKVEEFMDNDLSLDAATKASGFKIFDTAVNASETFYQFANQFYREFRYQSQLLELMIDIMLRVALEDGGISSEEETLIMDAVHIFRLDDGLYGRLKAKYTGGYSGYTGPAYGSASAGAAYSVLGCKSTDSDDTLKRAYRKLVSEYHPDKISSKGLPEEFQKVAKAKFIEIQNAWDKIKAARGL
ncbi:MAG: TerB family tellurite resistance protein [Spirochaetales bacterium]|nr:TerB family tellurite resistance protein [Spirochaetales bacterium]